MNEDQIRAKVEQLIKECDVTKVKIDRGMKIYTMQQNLTEHRLENLQQLLHSMKRAISFDFSTEMDAHGLHGEIDINFVKQELQVKFRAGDGYLPMTSLSGGERSKTLVVLITVLWKHHNSPFRWMDEWDVFMDEVGRKTTEDLLYKAAKNQRNKTQYFFLSPNNTTITDAHTFVIEDMAA